MSEQVEQSIITSIEVQKRRKDRFNIYVNGKYSFPVSEAVLIQTGLYKGMVLTDERKAEIENQNSAYLAYTIAIDYLSYGLRSEKEVRTKLKEQEVLLQYIDQTIERLRNQQYVDDLIYSESYVRTAANINRKGPNVIKQELLRKGVAEETILKALGEYPLELQVENIQKLSEKAWRKQQRVSRREGQIKVQLFLQQKGYDKETIQEAMITPDEEAVATQELEAVRIQGDKVRIRASRKKSGRELKQHVRTSLYQKGFPTELIQQYIDEQDFEEE